MVLEAEYANTNYKWRIRLARLHSYFKRDRRFDEESKASIYTWWRWLSIVGASRIGELLCKELLFHTCLVEIVWHFKNAVRLRNRWALLPGDTTNIHRPLLSFILPHFWPDCRSVRKYSKKISFVQTGAWMLQFRSHQYDWMKSAMSATNGWPPPVAN